MLLKQGIVNGNVILHDVVSNTSCNINLIRNIIKTCPSCVHIKNNKNKLPLDVAIDNQLSVDIIATLLLTSSTSSAAFLLFTSNNYSSHPLYGPLVKLLQSTSYDSVVRLHLCGYEGSGKSTLRHCIEASLTNYHSNISPFISSTIGMDISSFIDKRVKYVVFDYGGQSEYHVIHSRYLRGNDSIYVIVLNLSRFRDSEGNRLQSPVPLTANELVGLSEKYNYWLKFVNVATSTNSTDDSVCKAHVITCLNCDGSLFGSLFRSGSDIIASGIEVISKVQEEWLVRKSPLNRINFVNIVSDISVVNMISTESVYNKVVPMLRSKVNEIASVSTNNIKLVDDILKIRDEENSNWFDIGPRSDVISLLMISFPSTFPNNMKSGLAEAILSQLELIGEVLTFDDGDSNNQLVVTNPNKLTSNILGKLSQYLNDKKNQNQYVDFQAYSVTRDEILSQVSSSIRYSEGVDSNVIIQLLELLGVCIKCSNDYWFPVFAADNGTIQETNIFELSPEFRTNSRRVHRRYKLSDSQLEMFPLGYFSTLFAYISSMAVIEGNFQLYSDSILIPEHGVGRFPCPHMETILRISKDRSYFDVIVQSWIDDTSLDQLQESRYWSRLNAIRNLLYDDPKFIDYYHVEIDEYFIHPDPLIQSELAAKLINSQDYWPWLFGINGYKYGVNSPYLNPLQGKFINKISDNMHSSRSNIEYSDIKSIDKYGVNSPYLNPLQGKVIDKISDDMHSTRSNTAYSDIKSIDDKFETIINRLDDFEISSNSLLKEAMEIQFTHAITAKNLYLPFSADYPGATVLLPPTTDAEDDYLQKFDHIKDWLSSQYKAKAKCQLLYHPINSQPYCYILTTGDEDVVKEISDIIIDELSKQIKFSFTIIIDSHGNYSLGYNFEFKNYNDFKNLTSLDNLIREFDKADEIIDNFRNGLPSDNNLYVMYGHYYNYDTSKWEDRLALWVCYIDPIRRYFKTSIDERRPESFENLSIHYFSANFVENSLDETSLDSMDWWNEFDMVKPLMVGMKFCVVLERKKKSGTIGPSVKSIYPGSKIPDNWFFTCAHIFQDDSNEQYLEGCTLVDSTRTQPIGRLIALYRATDWAIIEIYHKSLSPSVKISIDEDQLPIEGSIDFHSFNINSVWPKVFKSGSASGVTKGKIFSWGHSINTKQFPSHQRDNIARPCEIFIQRDSSNLFAIPGDSGAPLLVLMENPLYAICAGLVTANLKIHDNLKLTIVSPIYKNMNHILNFVRSALLAQGKIANYDDSLY